MTSDEQRQAWRAYLTASLSAFDNRDYAMDAMAVVADFLLKTERKRFDGPDHSGDADTMVETRPWVSLTAIERIDLRGWFNRHDSATIDDLLIYHDEMLRANNRGTR